ncbi:hypothetical protein MUP01_10040 [Candidatus Bathyarchaeota archaeon]|nr:hypothetical protein [Candidatus Bathyarchaeota archaeon]
MARQVKTKINKVGSRHTIYLKTDLINDSNFPFHVGESLIVRIESNKLIIEKESKWVQQENSAKK